MATHAFHRYGVNSEAVAIDAPEVTFRRIPISGGERERLGPQLGAKFDEILYKYGAGEFIFDEKGNIVDIMPPEDYFREVDERILHAIKAGEEVDPSLVPTTSLLCQLARGQVSYLKSYSSQLRRDPQYVQSLVRSTAELRPELIPDENGEVENLEQMLKNPADLCKELRLIFHNTLLELGRWALVVRYLDDVVKFEEKVGYMAAQDVCQHLKDNARGMVKRSIEGISIRVKGSIRCLKRFERVWTRKADNEMTWRGSNLQLVLSKKSDLLFCSDTFDGHLFRFSLDPLPQIQDVDEFLFFMKRSNPEEINKLGISLVEDISMLHASYEFYQLLGALNPDISHKETIHAKRMEENGTISRALLDESPLERHVYNIEELGTENVLKKVWKEIDALVFKKKKHHIAECTYGTIIIGYEKPPARWIIPRQAPAVHCPSRLREVSQTAYPPEVAQNLLQSPNTEAHPEADDLPSDPLPQPAMQVFCPTPVLDDNTPEECPLIEQRIDTLTKGKARDTADSGAAVEATCTVTVSIEKAEGGRAHRAPEPLFKVKKWAYTILEKLFDPSVKGRVRQLDFVKVMTSPPLNFSLKPGHGSAQVLYPPVERGISCQPFGIHRIHGRKDELDAGYERDYASRLTDDYGWTLANFEVA